MKKFFMLLATILLMAFVSCSMDGGGGDESETMETISGSNGQNARGSSVTYNLTRIPDFQRDLGININTLFSNGYTANYDGTIENFHSVVDNKSYTVIIDSYYNYQYNSECYAFYYLNSSVHEIKLVKLGITFDGCSHLSSPPQTLTAEQLRNYNVQTFTW